MAFSWQQDLEEEKEIYILYIPSTVPSNFNYFVYYRNSSTTVPYILTDLNLIDFEELVQGHTYGHRSHLKKQWSWAHTL